MAATIVQSRDRSKSAAVDVDGPLNCRQHSTTIATIQYRSARINGEIPHSETGQSVSVIKGSPAGGTARRFAMSGVFRVPQGAAAISVWLKQAERKDDPQDGSAARFADVRMVLFPSEDAARASVTAYR
jgi:hypothetical protein